MHKKEGSSSRIIPRNIRRQVRKRCYFGCIICGSPIFQYDHVINYSLVKKHEASNIILLCGSHHQDKTSKRISKQVLQHFINNPINKNRTFSNKHLIPIGEPIQLRVGGNQYSFTFSHEKKTFDAIKINNKSIVGIVYEDGGLLLNICMTDKDGIEILKVEKGDLKVSTGVWDFQFEGKRLWINSKPRNIEFEMLWHEDGIEISRGYFTDKISALQIFPDKCVMLPLQTTLAGCEFRNCRVGLEVINDEIKIGIP